MSTRTFTLDELNEYDLYEGGDDVALREGRGARRWSETFEVVFRADDGKHYLINVEEGLTEYQDYHGDERYPDRKRDEAGGWSVSCPEVELFEAFKPVTAWRKV